MTDYNRFNDTNNNIDEYRSKIRQVYEYYDEDQFDDESFTRGNSSASGQERGTSSYSGRSSAGRSLSGRTSSGRTTASGHSRSSASSGTRSSRSASSASYRSSSTTGRTSSSGSSASRRKQHTFAKRKKKFKKYLMIYVAALVAILIIGSIIFSVYLSSYEKGQPYHAAETVVKNYESQEGIVNFVTANAEKTALMGNVDEIAQIYATNIAGKEISYIENAEYRTEAPSYDIRADGATVAKVTFDSDNQLTSLNITDYLPDTMSVTISAPAGSSVNVNGTVLSPDLITSSGVPEELANVVQFLASVPEYDTYQVSGLVSDPQISITDASGNALDVSKTDAGYTATLPADQTFIDSVEPRVMDAIENYATYFIYMSFDLANYIAYGSDLYGYVFGNDEWDKIDPWLYNWEQIDHYEFAEKSAGNYIKYSDDCFTVDIKYALDMYFTDPSYSDNNQKMDATWVFVIEPLDGSWCIGDIINH